MKEQKDLASALDEELAGLQFGEESKNRVLRSTDVWQEKRRHARALVPALCCLAGALILALLFYNPRPDHTDAQMPFHLQQGEQAFHTQSVEQRQDGCVMDLLGAEMQESKLVLCYRLGYADAAASDAQGGEGMPVLFYNTIDRITPANRRAWLDAYVPSWRSWWDGEAVRVLGGLFPLMKLEGVVTTFRVSLSGTEGESLWVLEESGVGEDGSVRAVYAPGDLAAPLPKTGDHIILRPDTLRLGGWIKHDVCPPETFEVEHACPQDALYACVIR